MIKIGKTYLVEKKERTTRLTTRPMMLTISSNKTQLVEKKERTTRLTTRPTMLTISSNNKVFMIRSSYIIVVDVRGNTSQQRNIDSLFMARTTTNRYSQHAKENHASACPQSSNDDNSIVYDENCPPSIPKLM